MQKPYPDNHLSQYGVDVVSGALQVSKEFGVRYLMEAYLTRVPDDDEAARYAHERSCMVLSAVADYFLAAALGEARHWSDKTWAGAFRWYERNAKLRDLFEHYYKVVSISTERDAAAEYLWSHIPGDPAEVAGQTEAFFNHSPWNGCFGGPSWAYIAHFAKYLYQLPTKYPDNYYDVLVALDQVAHITHTGASVMLRPKFGWFNTWWLAPLVILAAEGDLCCWLFDHSHLWGPISQKSELMRNVQRSVPDEIYARISEWAGGHKFARKGHKCADVLNNVEHGSVRKPEEQEIYIREHPPLPPAEAEFGMCWSCGSRFHRSLKRCPNYCKVCKHCFVPNHVNHCPHCKMSNVSEYHREECEALQAQKLQGEGENEPEVDLQETGTAPA